ncbi:MAG: MFS transporter, partial [Pollutimonas bauzanensis]
LVRRLPSRRFIPLVYLFFIGNIAVFGVLFALAGAGWQVWIGRAFFIWLSVFNLFVVSVFWALMTDVFSPAQAKRLFGTLAAAATVGAIAGSGVTAFLARHLATAMLLVLAGALLVIAIACVWRVLALAPARAADPADPAAADGGLEAVVGGSIFAGITHTLRSPYLLNIGLYILLYTITSTFLYFEQAAIA